MGGKCKFKPSWLEKYKWLKAIEGDSTSAACKWCNSSFKVNQKGEGDVTRHADSDKHKSAAQNMPDSVATFFKGVCHCYDNLSFLCV